MKRTLLETRRQVASAIVCGYPGGRECAAARLGMPLKKFDNHLYESKGSRPLSDEQLHLLEAESGTTYLPDYMAAMYGGVFVPIADPSELDNLDLYSRSVKTAVKRGRVDQIIAEALEDGVIDEREVETILAAHRKHIAARHAEVHAVIVLHSEVRR
ncbi:YmfL family putative regulatory protein [Azotobacter vinelandii]|uniref:YmfL family putative regulatory protein n=1 Tax=Azotobacter TaxID=352 RepID=UPI001587CF28|nr:YmfL family putative regulatory protein [Azotobacter vinelandii]